MTLTEEPRQAPAGQSPGGLRRDVGLLGLFFTGVGSIIGSGWLFGALSTSRQAGPAAIVSWMLGGIMIMLIGLAYAELGAMLPMSGGAVRFPHLVFGSFASFTTGWINWLAAASVAPIEVEGALQYATYYVPWLTRLDAGVPVLTGGGLAVAIAFLALFSVINVVGVKLFEKANTILVWWKLIIILLVVVALVGTAFHPANFHTQGFAPNGFSGIVTSIATAGVVFSYFGFRQGVDLAGESKNPRRNVPIAVIGSILITMAIYVGLQVAFIGALPTSLLSHGWSALDFPNAFGPLAALATLLGLPWLATLLYADAVVSPADTGLIYTTVTSRLSYAMSKNGNAPQGLAALSRRGVPWVSIILTFVTGLIFFMPFPGWQKMVGFITSATVLSFGSGPLVVAALRRRAPEQERPFRLPGGDVIPFLAFYSSNLIVFWTGWETDRKLFVAIMIGFLLFVIQSFRKPTRNLARDLRAGLWVCPWLVGLALLSWLGPFGGGLKMISFAGAFPVIAAFSLAIYVLAICFCLAAPVVQESLALAMDEETTPPTQPHLSDAAREGTFDSPDGSAPEFGDYFRPPATRYDSPDLQEGSAQVAASGQSPRRNSTLASSRYRIAAFFRRRPER
ncbi:APC family permease [Streptomyces sp. NPDC002573]|uniref:APC family permease n=1 Tax=Streptomyces sp. NPDC002573 TaxID=3364651 RepID=UPI0036B8953A